MIPYEIIQRVEAIPLEDILADITTMRGKRYICPFCESGNGKHKTSAFTIYEGNRYYCFSCNEYGSPITLIGELYDLTFIRAVRKLCEMFNIPYENRREEKKQSVLIETGIKYGWKDNAMTEEMIFEDIDLLKRKIQQKKYKSLRTANSELTDQEMNTWLYRYNKGMSLQKTVGDYTRDIIRKVMLKTIYDDRALKGKIILDQIKRMDLPGKICRDSNKWQPVITYLFSIHKDCYWRGPMEVGNE